MKRRILSSLMALVLCLTLLPAAAYAAGGTAVYVRSDGSDSNAGTQTAPYATLAKAVKEAEDGSTIYVMSNLTMTKCARYYDKDLTITSLDPNNPVTISRGTEFDPQSDHARSWYNPAMVEVQTTGGEGAGLTLTNIIFDDDGKKEGTVFAQAVSDGSIDNKTCVQDAIIASNATVPTTITLGDGAVLRNFGGMSAVRVTDQAQLVMAEGSIIEDTTVTDRTKGKAQGEVGPAGAIWIQGSSFTMNAGAVIRNIIGRAVYADGGTATVGGAINDIKPDSDMWQKTNGIAIHLRNQAIGTLDSTCSIDNQNTKVGGESIICSNACDLTVYDGAVIKNATQTKGIAALGTCRVDFDGEITGLKGNSNALNLQNGEFNVTLGKNANIHDNQTGYGTIYIQAQNGKLDIYGKINIIFFCSFDKTAYYIIMIWTMTVFCTDGYLCFIAGKSFSDTSHINRNDFCNPFWDGCCSTMSYFFKDCNMLVNHSLWCHMLFFQIFCISQQNSYTQFIIQKTALNISGLCHCCSWIKAHKITGHNTQLFCIFFCFYIFIQDNFNRIITSLYAIIFIVYMNRCIDQL